LVHIFSDAPPLTVLEGLIGAASGETLTLDPRVLRDRIAFVRCRRG
jgi:hypothetical protein